MDIDLSKTKAATAEAVKPRFKLNWGWRYIDASIVVMGMLIAILVWFIPSLDQNKDMQAFIKSQREIKEMNAKILAAQARIKKEEEELGLIWIPPPASLQATQGSAKKPPKPGAKPAPAQKQQ